MRAIDHVDENVLEQYSLGSASAEETAALEEHLLICDYCRQRLLQVDWFITAIRAAFSTNAAG
jgi:anti-sigma factor RsiW